MNADASDRPLGAVVRDWTPPPWPTVAALQGRYVRLEPLSPDRHAKALFDAYQGHDALWDYMAYGPFATFDSYREWMVPAVAQAETVFFAVRSLETDRIGGVTSYLRIKPAAGSIEVGHINYAPALQRTRAATEAMALMMGWAFDAGYRRYEWKCDALNMASRRAAFGIQLRGHVPAGHGREGTQPRYRMVRRDRQRLAHLAHSVPAMAGAVEFRRQGASDHRVGRSDGAGARVI